IKSVNVKTDVFDINIDPVGGNIVSAKLIKYPVDIDQPNNPFPLLSPNLNQLYVIQSGITNPQLKQPIIYNANQQQYVMQNDQQTLPVVLTGRTADGLQVTKIYTFTHDSYAIKLRYQIKNISNIPWHGSIYQQITRRNFVIPASWHS